MRLAKALLIATFALHSVLCVTQEQGTSAQVPLRNLSSDQLKKCLDLPTACGRSDTWEIRDELVSRLPSLSSEQLIACFDDWRICGTGEGPASGWPISDELARRGNIRELLTRFWKESKPTLRGGIEHVAYHFDNPEVTAFMRKIFEERIDDGEGLYWPINYLAKRCDQSALGELATGRFRNVGCIQYETSVKLFGKCKYRQAVPYLVEAALHDFCGNVIEAVQESLYAIYPKSPREFDELKQLQEFYCDQAKKDGFTVSCN